MRELPGCNLNSSLACGQSRVYVLSVFVEGEVRSATTGVIVTVLTKGPSVIRDVAPSSV